MRAWTDYPFSELGDLPSRPAPVREVDALSWDGNKYVVLRVPGIAHVVAIKACYCYLASGRCGEVEVLDVSLLPVSGVR